MEVLGFDTTGELRFTKNQWLKFARNHKKIIGIKKRRANIAKLVPSINSYYMYKALRKGRWATVQKFLAPESRVYLEFYTSLIPKGVKCLDKSWKFRFTIHLFYKGNPVVDIDNLKPLFDIFTGILYEDDSQVFSLKVTKKTGCRKTYAVIKWEAYQ